MGELTFGRVCKYLWVIKSTLVIVLTPLLLLPFLIVGETQVAKCGYIIILMAIYWLTECIPMGVTALIPVILVPLMGIMKSADISMNYIKDISMLQIAGLMVALGIERVNLHRRIALRILLLLGTQPRWLMLGFLSVTWFLAMFMSTSGSTVAMMLPTLEAVLSNLEELRKEGECEDIEIVPLEDVPTRYIKEEHEPVTLNLVTGSDGDAPEDFRYAPEKQSSMADSHETAKHTGRHASMEKGLTLCIAYATAVGGIGTLTGHSANLIFKENADELYEKFGMGGSGVTFVSWLAFGFPCSILCLVLTWIWMQFAFLGWRSLCGCCLKTHKIDGNAVKAVLRRHYEALGKFTFGECVVTGHFVILILLWLTRDPRFVPGWAIAFKQGYVTDATAAMLLAFSLFVWPAHIPTIFKRNNPKLDQVASILDWETVHSKMPWHIILLIGGGVALAKAAQVSGLSDWLALGLRMLTHLPPWAMVLILSMSASMMTEIISNTATSTLLMPVLGALAVEIKVHPLYIMWPAAMGTNLSFMLPVATSANAFVFAFGRLKIMDMVKAGFMMNVICILVINLAINSWGYAVFDLGTFPFAPTHNLTQVDTVQNMTTGDNTTASYGIY
ncbi:unnamed protein product [Owenia fusiformis]|uniref:Uncharacterized protein n=1 Tax=Owenia fusiformis TaxID=6347 RepID=A0A8J1TNP5_OWEFU|nr:unnamed protein product [Owenia fusiformis]